MEQPVIQISSNIFWQAYNALRNAEGILWECNGATNPEDENLTELITDCSREISIVLDKLQPIVNNLKDHE